jgi:hypothetical protein
MFYDAVANAHGLAVDPFLALVAPRPIGWISTLGRNGVVKLLQCRLGRPAFRDVRFRRAQG